VGIKPDPHQYCLIPNGILKAKSQVIIALKAGKTVTKIDIKNAFNSIPREIIFKSLEAHGVNKNFIDYLKHFLWNRKCSTDNIDYQVDGVP